MSQPEFTMLYDGDCPFCRLEVRWLKRRDRRHALNAIDISSRDFVAGDYGATQIALRGHLHGVRSDGSLTTGMQSFRDVYQAAGLGWLMAPTGWPVLRGLFDALYSVFAHYRVRLWRMIGRSCDSGICRR